MKAKFILDIFSPDARLQHFRLWLVVGFLLVIGINYYSLVTYMWLPMPGNTDKIYHAASYCLLMLWWLQLFPLRLARILLALAFIGMGIGLEVMQSFNPMRYMDIGDMAANSTGVVVAFMVGLTRMDQLLLKIERWFVKVN